MAYTFFKEALKPNTTYEQLANSGEFETLDGKFASAISDIAKGELGRKLTLATEKEDKKDKMITGRQLLRLIWEQCKVDEASGALYDLTDLMAVKMKGDNPGPKLLSAFMTCWESTLEHMKDT
jgi:hypothetical protein